MHEREPLIGPHGGYRKLKIFQLGQLVYDITVVFCQRFNLAEVTPSQELYFPS